MNAWTFVWLMVFLKIPIAALFGIVWWAVRQGPETEHSPEDDGGTKHMPPRPRHPHRPSLPRTPRRGPHGESSPHPPARVRVTTARARRIAR